MTKPSLLLFLAEAALRWSVPLLFVSTAFAIHRWAARQSAPPVWRNWICRALLAALLAMPLLLAAPLSLPAPKIPAVTFARRGRELFPVSQRTEKVIDSTVRSEPAKRFAKRLSFTGMLTALYTAIAAALVLRLLLGASRLHSMIADSQLCDTVACPGGMPVEIRLLKDLRSPAAFVWSRRIIFVPLDWTAWPAGEQAAVMTHELAHLRRHDGWWQWLASLAAAAFWFHPGVWWLRRELLLSAEECCDREVLDAGLDAHRYARLLLSLTTVRMPGPALAMAASGTLERRIQSLLSFSGPPPSSNPGLSRSWLLAASACLGIALYAAAAVGQSSQPSRDPGYDPAKLEAMLRRDPDSLFLHARLTLLNWNLRDPSGYYRHLKWLAVHHPEVPEAGWGHYSGSVVAPEALMTKAWSQALVRSRQSAAVTVNAGRWFRDSDPVRALALFRQAQSQPDLESMSVQAICQKLRSASTGSCRVSPLPTALQDKLTDQVSRLSDPAQLSSLGTHLSRFPDRSMVDEGTRLLVRAIQLEPQNPRWREALESALAEPVRRENLRRIFAAR